MEKHSREEPAPPSHFTAEQTEVWGGEVCAQVNGGSRAGPESKAGRSAVVGMLGFLPALDLLCLTRRDTHGHEMLAERQPGCPRHVGRAHPVRHSPQTPTLSASSTSVLQLFSRIPKDP